MGGSQSAAYAPQSGEITGILKQLNEEMGKTLSEATYIEKEAISNYDALMAAKKKEVDSLTSSIERKTVMDDKKKGLERTISDSETAIAAKKDLPL